MRPHRKDERGAILVLTALLITALLLIVAIVIDLGATRSDRRGAQLAVDSAVSAGALAMSEATTDAGQVACEEAFDYLEATLGVTLDDTAPNEPCSKVASCNPAVEVTVIRRAGPYAVTVHHPVINPDLLDRTSTIGATSFMPGDDGTPCQRIGVRITTTDDAYFGGVAGSGDRISTIWAVARVNNKQKVNRPLNLLVLDRTGCQTLTVGGGGTAEVLSYVDKDGVTQPGVAGVDSDGSLCKKNPKGWTEAAIQMNGGPSKLKAFGPLECPDGTMTCGVIETYAPVANGSCDPDPGTDRPACDRGTGSITPKVTQMAERLTRSAIDYRYNCKSVYTVADHAWVSTQPIAGCTEGPTATSDWVDELFAYVKAVQATPALYALPPHSFDVSISDANKNCGLTKDATYVGNVYVNCKDFSVSGGAKVVFTGGNVIFGGNVTVSSGSLTINRCSVGECLASTSWTSGADFEEWRSSAKGAWAYASGTFTNKSSITLNNTTLFLGPSGLLDQAGGSNFTWSAPNDGNTDDGTAGPFEDLALWSEGTGVHKYAGGGATDLEGVFFAGRATLDFGGTSDMALTDAQFISNRLSFSGGNVFQMAPNPYRSVDFERPAGYTLIR